MRIVYVGGPAEYDGQVTLAEPHEGGLVWEPGSPYSGPEAWFRVDLEGEPVSTEEGPAQEAHYVGPNPPAED